MQPNQIVDKITNLVHTLQSQVTTMCANMKKQTKITKI